MENIALRNVRYTWPRLLFGALFLFLCLAFPSPGLAASVEVRISGVEGEALENARLMASLPEGLIRENKINEPLLHRFVDNVANLVAEALKPFGYYHPEVEAHLEGAGDHYIVAIAVTPGVPVRISRLSVGLEGTGSGEDELSRLVRTFPLQEGAILRQGVYEEAKSALLARAIALGYLDAYFSRHTVRIRARENTADIELLLDTGRRYFFGDVTFSGVTSYPDGFLRRYLTFKPGEAFSYAKLAETRAALGNSNRFKVTAVTPEKEEARDGRVPVKIVLSSLPSQEFKVGGGYGTDTGARFTLGYRYLNFFHRGHEFQSDLDVAERLQSITGRYLIPAAGSATSFTALNFTAKRENVVTYTASTYSFDIDRERSLGKGRMGSLYLRFLREQSDVGGERTTSFLVLPGVKLAAQAFDDPMRPGRGYRFETEVRGTSTFLGSDQTFVQFLADGGFAYRLSPSWTVLARGQFGCTLQRESLSDLPATLRFFAGGDRSVRGYAYKSLGPKDDNGDVIGGKDLLVGSIEVERAIARDWGIAAFYDAGNAFDDFSRLTLFRGVGMGVRYYSRVGPIRLDFAHPLDTGSPSVRIHLTFGFAL